MIIKKILCLCIAFLVHTNMLLAQEVQDEESLKREIVGFATWTATIQFFEAYVKDTTKSEYHDDAKGIIQKLKSNFPEEISKQTLTKFFSKNKMSGSGKKIIVFYESITGINDMDDLIAKIKETDTLGDYNSINLSSPIDSFLNSPTEEKVKILTKEELTNKLDSLNKTMIELKANVKSKSSLAIYLSLFVLLVLIIFIVFYFFYLGKTNAKDDELEDDNTNGGDKGVAGGDEETNTSSVKGYSKRMEDIEKKVKDHKNSISTMLTKVREIEGLAKRLADLELKLNGNSDSSGGSSSNGEEELAEFSNTNPKVKYAGKAIDGCFRDLLDEPHLYDSYYEVIITSSDSATFKFFNQSSNIRTAFGSPSIVTDACFPQNEADSSHTKVVTQREEGVLKKQGDGSWKIIEKAKIRYE